MKKVFLFVVLCTVILSSCVSTNTAPQGNTGTVSVSTIPASGTTPSSGTAPSSGTIQSSGASTATGQLPSGTAVAVGARVSDFFPFEDNVHMKYKGSGNEYAAYETFTDYVKNGVMQVRSNNGGTEQVTVYAVRSGSLVSLFRRGETYFKYDFTARSDHADVLLKEPLVQGTSWTASDGSSRSITSINSQIATPAGKFIAIEVTTAGKDVTGKDYYAKGIGLVKSEFKPNDGSASVTSELEKVQKGVPFRQTIRFYFPQFNKNRIVYVERQVEIKTNEDIKYKFQKELKTIPVKGGLTKTLTKNTKILGFTLDDAKNTVTIDLSGDFVKEINAGSGLEGMLLQSIVNTTGNYFMKDDVIVTVEGKPYESGHFLLKQGETMKVKKDNAIQYK